MEQLKIEYLPVSEVKPYGKNARKHGGEDVKAIVNSIKEFGFDDPIGVWGKDNVIVEGHGRLEAAKKLGMESVPVIHLDHLTDEQRRAYALAHNKTAELSEWDFDILGDELENIFSIDMEGLGFEFEEDGADFFQNRERNDTSREEGNEEYNEFLDKFEAKKTTDDCYTPDTIYQAVSEWVQNEYGLKESDFVRPFYPGGDYQSFKYKPGAIVVDNPPFSILAEIVRFYTEKGIKFFLFAPHLTLFSSSASFACSVCIGAAVTYENGANVNTSFLTNLENGVRLRSAPALYRAITEANKKNLKELHRELPKYEYNDYVITSTRCGQFSRYGIDFCVPVEESEHIRQLDAQKESGKAIFGSAFLISERLKKEKQKAEREKAEREKAEREKAERWELSEREMDIVRSLG